MTPYDFVCNIAKMRAKKGYFARLLSQLIDRDEAYINKLENLKTNPSLSTLFEIISACDCSFETSFCSTIVTQTESFWSFFMLAPLRARIRF